VREKAAAPALARVTLRDYFAVHVLCATDTLEWERFGRASALTVATRAYFIADAMLIARESAIRTKADMMKNVAF
jgi:hypothetical protein